MKFDTCETSPVSSLTRVEKCSTAEQTRSFLFFEKYANIIHISNFLRNLLPVFEILLQPRSSAPWTHFEQDPKTCLYESKSWLRHRTYIFNQSSNYFKNLNDALNSVRICQLNANDFLEILAVKQSSVFKVLDDRN